MSDATNQTAVMTAPSTADILAHLGQPGDRRARLETFIMRMRIAAHSNRAAKTLPTADDIQAMAQLALVTTEMVADILITCRAAMDNGSVILPDKMADYITQNLPVLEEIVYGKTVKS